MPNPWLDIPLEDYEGHMASAGVRQNEALSDLFAEALAFRRPASVAVLGVAGGNGLDRIDNHVTERVVGLDLNPLYLDAVRVRYCHLRGLELHCIDLAEQTAKLQPLQLVHAALVFEHAGVGRCLESAVALVAEDGALSVVLQLPSSIESGVSNGGYSSIQKLKSHFSFVDPVSFRKSLEDRAFALIHETRRSLAAGKAFWMGIFVRV